MSFIKRFLGLESASGIILLLVAVLSMLWANSAISVIHQKFIHVSLFFVNEGLMCLFFLMVGLELKRGYLEGQLRTKSQIGLPLIAAVGGMLVPAVIYIIINWTSPLTLKAWATPTATDIAFVLGVLSLFGRRVPTSLKLFLLALAIFDDIGAILIMVFYYSQSLSWLFLSLVFGLVMVLFLLNRAAVSSLMFYFFIGLLLWFALLYAGIHPTLAGVILAFCIPATKASTSPLHRIEKGLHPWVAYLIMPLFALVNAGFSLHTVTGEMLTSKLSLGIIAGLFFGKQIGVFLFAYAVIRLKLAKLPPGCSWLQLYAGALLCGIGFTMSLFLGTLSFPNQGIYVTEVQLGVMIGSLLSSLMGAAVLLLTFVPWFHAHNRHS